MKNSIFQKAGFSLLIVIIAILIIGLIVFGFKNWPGQVEQNEQIKNKAINDLQKVNDNLKKSNQEIVENLADTPTTINTADWQIFTNTQYAFQFQHPESWFVSKNSATSWDITNYSSEEARDFLRPGQTKIQLQIHSKLASDSMEKFATQLNRASIEDLGIEANENNFKKITLGEKNFFHTLVGNEAYLYELTPTSVAVVLLFLDEKRTDEDMALKVISTLKFTK